jgi:transcriptional regulator with GAF, ATPase, and Fis domain
LAAVNQVSSGPLVTQTGREEVALVAEEKPTLPTERYEDLLESLTELGRTLAEDESVQETLGSILTLTTRLVPGCHAASVTVLDDDEKPATVAATDAEQEELDRRQYALRDGPCLDAARRQIINNWSLAEAEQSWPEFSALATEMGLRSYLAAGLGLGGHRLGALNLSSRGQDGFDRLDEGLVGLFVPLASAAIVTVSRYEQARELATQLSQALSSRAVIDHAIGIIMAESKCPAGQAFAVLRRASNNRRMKLRELAAEIVTRVGGQPPAEDAPQA